MCGLSSCVLEGFFVCFGRPWISAFSHLLDLVCSECWKSIDSSQKSPVPQLTGMCFQQTHNSVHTSSLRVGLQIVLLLEKHFHMESC